MKALVVLATAVVLAPGLLSQTQKLKTGLWPEDWAYKLAPGVTSKSIVYYSDGTACYGKIFYPKDFSAQGKTAGVVLGQGWARFHFSIEKYAARFAERGLVALAIDYRGWGSSDGFVSLAHQTTGGDEHRDDKHITETRTDVVIKRTRLIPLKQVEDYRNAISFLQGEPGVDPERIGVWGSSFAGGHGISVAGMDARVKAVAIQVPAISGNGVSPGPAKLEGKAREDAIQRARTGQGGEFETGFSFRRMVDVETQQAVAEYRPFRYVPLVKVPVLLIVAEKDELINNKTNARAVYELLTGPKDYIEVPGITHFEMYINDAFERSSNAAAGWFVKYLAAN
jgi:cephalosporin-C deacetylase-like acetyl esterase